jgi:polyhydroxybutyrate depolymerase
MKSAPPYLVFSVLSVLAVAGCSEDKPKTRETGNSSSTCDQDDDECCDPEEEDCDEPTDETDETDDSDKDAGQKPDAKAQVDAKVDVKSPVALPSTDAGPPKAASDAGTSGDAGTGDSTGSAMSCSGKKGAPGTATRMLMGREYVVHIPAMADPNSAIPLVFVVHGASMSGPLMQTLTGMDAVADVDKFAVAYPSSNPLSPWNVGTNACLPGGLISNPQDDFTFFKGMRDAIGADQCLDNGKVFVTGFSMGGYFSYHMACQNPEKFARAVGPASGGTYTGDCPGAPIPMIIMHGSQDTFIDYNVCGKGARDMWIKRNKCSDKFETKPSGTGTCDWYQGCDPNGQLAFCSYPVAHNWGGNDATKEVWKFFKTYL